MNNQNWPFPTGTPLAGVLGGGNNPSSGAPMGAVLGNPPGGDAMGAMADGLGKFVPGFDFLQTLAKGAGSVVPNMNQWVAPTISIEDLDKRIEELKAVQFWLDQNAKMIGTTIQALEVQKMSLSTLKAMNFNLGDVAQALKARVAQAAFGPADAATAAAAPTKARAVKTKPKAKPRTAAGAPPVDPMQWWGALTQQFAQIAGSAMKDAAMKNTTDMAKSMASGVAGSMARSARDAGVRATQAGVKAGLAAGMAGAGLAAGAAKQAAKTARSAAQSAVRSSAGEKPSSKRGAKR